MHSFGDFSSDATESDDRQGLAIQFFSHERRTLPRSGLQGTAGSWNTPEQRGRSTRETRASFSPGQGTDQRTRVFSCRESVPTGSTETDEKREREREKDPSEKREVNALHHENSMTGGGIGVDVVRSCSCPTDQFQSWTSFDDRTSDFRCTSNDENISVLDKKVKRMRMRRHSLKKYLSSANEFFLRLFR